MRFEVVFIALLAAVCIAQTNCEPEITFGDGSVWKFNLTGLWHAKGQDDKIVAQDSDLNNYYINVCGETTTASDDECKGASVCQEGLAYDHHNAGSLKSQTFSYDNSTEPGKGLIITYGNGDTCSGGDVRTTNLILVCDPYCESPLVDTAKEIAHCAYSIRITSKYACGEKGSSSGGAGETFALVVLLILLIGAVLYFAIGAVYQKKKKDASNLREMIIHNEFWCSLPGMVKDGFLFIIHGCKKGDYISV